MAVANSDELRRSAAVEVFLALKDTDEFKIRQKMIEKELEKTVISFGGRGLKILGLEKSNHQEKSGS
jgi:hypothetical protein